MDAAMRLFEDRNRNASARAVDLHRPERLRQRSGSQDRRIAAVFRRLEAIEETLQDTVDGPRIAVDIDALAHEISDSAQIVDPVKLVGVVMGDENGVEFGRTRVEELLAQLG